MRHGSDNSNLDDAIREAIPPRCFALSVGNLLERHKLSHARKNFIQGDYDYWRPNAIFFERHELDEAHHHMFFARELSEVGDLIFIESAQQHAVDLYRIDPRLPRCAHPGQNDFESIGNPGDASEPFRIYRIHAHGDAIESSIF